MSIYDFNVQDSQGHEKPLSDYKGKVLLVVNVASKCGNTPQYAGLQQLYQSMSARGLEILGFPCDQFGHQEPGTNAEIQQFCQLNYGVTFPVFAKIDVNGEGAHPLYRYLTEQMPGSKGKRIDWNFAKFLIDKDGTIVERFDPKAQPEAIAPEIEKLLAEK